MTATLATIGQAAEGTAPADDGFGDIRARLNAHKASTGLSWTDLHRQIGVPSSTLSLFASGGYSGRNDRVAAQVERFLDGVVTAQLKAIELPEPPEFVELTASAEILAALAYAQRGRMVGIACASGHGKTTTMHEYQRRAANVWITRLKPSTAGVQPMLVELLKALGQPEATGSPHQLSARVVDKVARSRGLLIIDEVQHASDKAIEELRSIHDATGVGLALVGSQDVLARLESGPRARVMAQSNSRVSMKLVRVTVDPADADRLSRAWGIEAPDQLAFLRALAEKPGALRNIGKAVELAHILAAGAPLSLGDLRDAWAQLSASLPK